MTWIIMLFVSFICGSLPFSVWLGKVFLKVDVREFGDGNPGSANVFRSGSKAIGALALCLDISKAAAPVGLSYYNLGIRGIPMYLIAIAPIFGHVFSPFLKFHGGKAIAASLGVWIGLTIWKASLVGVVGTIVGIALMTSSGWAVMLGMVMILLVLFFWIPDPLLLMVGVSDTIILAWTHCSELRKKPVLRPLLTRRNTPKS
jgi:acyl phosphate:glycerol-3-phosphate acyltransferase